MTPSSQGDSLSARSRIESLVYASAGSEEAMASQPVVPAPVLQAAPEATPVLNLQRQLEVMRFVIISENQKLKDLVKQADERLGDVRRQLDMAAGAGNGTSAGSNAGTGAGTSPLACAWEAASDKLAVPARLSGPRCVEWRLRNVGEALRHSPASWRERKEFRLPEFPGLDFTLELRSLTEEGLQQPHQPWAAVANSGSSRPPVVSATPSSAGGYPSASAQAAPVAASCGACELLLEAAGAAPGGLELCASLSLSLERADGTQEAWPAASFQGRTSEPPAPAGPVALRHGGRAAHRQSWPPALTSCSDGDLTVVCRVKLEAPCQPSGPMCLRSTFEPSA